jgi:hypothetical protein
MKAPTDVLAEVMNPGKPSNDANVPRFKTGTMDTAGSNSGGGSVSKEGSAGAVPKGPTTMGGNTRVGGKDMSLYGSAFTAKEANGATSRTVTTEKGTKTTYYDAGGKSLGAVEKSTEDGISTTKVYDADGKYVTKAVTSSDGKTTVYDKDGKQKTYDTGEGGNVLEAPTAEEFLRLKNFGGGYTDGRPELQSNTSMQKDPVKADPNFGVIDKNPDYIEETADKPNLGNIAQPETRPELQGGPKPDAPPSSAGDPTSNPS